MQTPRLLDGRLKLRHLLLVDALTKYHSMARAAEHLHAGQPGLSRSLAELEEILGVTLFERTPRGVVPTQFGAAFTGYARNALAQLGLAATHLAELAEGRCGTARVGTHLFGSNVLLPQAISALKAEAPQATVVVHNATPDDLQADLLAGRVDLLVGRLQGPAAIDGWSVAPMYDEPICVVARENHPLHGKTPALRCLIDQPWVVPVVGTWLRRDFEDLLARHGLDLPANRVESTSYLTMHRLIMSTDTVGLLPALVVSEDPRMRPIARLPKLSQAIGVTTVNDRHLPPVTRRLLSHLAKTGEHVRRLITALPVPPPVDGLTG